MGIFNGGYLQLSARARTGQYLLFACLLGLLPFAAHAAPERLSDIIPDAVPDLEGKLNISWNHQELSLEGPFSSAGSAHDFLKLRYTFSPDVSGAVRYGRHDLGGGPGLVSPLFNNKDSAQSLEFDFAINLLNMEATPADAAANIAFGAGSAFNLGVAATLYELEAGSISQNETLLKAYLAYSTDLTEKLRAHTYFSTGRLSGDEASGSVNRIGAGLDYLLIDGCRPLVLMADGALDVYNFRQPSFNTSRVSQFNLGLRYQFADNWHANLGWQTVNDSESDSSGSGIFAGLNFVDGGSCDCAICAELPEDSHEAAPAEGGPLPESQPAPAPPAEEGAQAPAETQASSPPMMQLDKNPGSKAVASADNGLALPPLLSEEEQLAADIAKADESGLVQLSLGEQEEQEGGDLGLPLFPADERASAPRDAIGGVTIPPFPQERPRHTSPKAQLVRAPQVETERSVEHTAAEGSAEIAGWEGAPIIEAAAASEQSVEVLVGKRSISEKAALSLLAAANRVLRLKAAAPGQD